MSRGRISNAGCWGVVLLFAGCTSLMCPSRPATEQTTSTAGPPAPTYHRAPDPERAAREMAAVEAEMKKVNAAPQEDTQRPDLMRSRGAPRPDLESLRGMVNQADAYQRHPEQFAPAPEEAPAGYVRAAGSPVGGYRVRSTRSRRPPDNASYSVGVRSYTRKDGTIVTGHQRRKPGGKRL